jgi:AcrR family transcriptional regulator
MVRQRIIREALELFVRSGVKSTTMDDLAKYMGISKRTIYENFEDKEDLLIACIDSFHREKEAFVEMLFRTADNVMEAILIFLRKGATQWRFDMLNDIRKYYPQVYRDHVERIRQNECAKIAGFVQRGISEGVFRGDLNPEIIAYAFNRLADMFNSRELDGFSFVKILDNIVITFLRGICTSKGAEIIDGNKEKILKH